MNRQMTFTIGGLGVIALLLVIITLLFPGKPSTFGSTPHGIPANYGSSSTLTVGNAVGVLFRETTNCASRVITTQGAALLIQFTSSALASTSLNAVQGTVQLASTTVAYDSGIYGCGVWTQMGLGGLPTTTISISEFR